MFLHVLVHVLHGLVTHFMVFSSGAKTARSRAAADFGGNCKKTHCKMMDIVTPKKIEIGDIRIVITRVFVYLFGAYYMCECVHPAPQW